MYTINEADWAWAEQTGEAIAASLRLTMLLDEARQEARIALWHCAKRYAPGFPVSLRQYAFRRVVGRIQDMVRAMAGRSGHHNKLLRGKRITDRQDSQVDHNYFVAVLDSQREPLDLLVQRETVEELYAQTDDRSRLILDSLSGLRTQREVAAHCGVSEGRVSQLVTTTVAQLRRGAPR